MRFSHTADCHIGGHRDQRLRTLTEQAFSEFITGTIEENVDFAIIAGDLFNTAIPGIDTLKFTVSQLSRLRARGIPAYAIPGSHDYSPSGKTMLDVLEEAGLLINVCKGTITPEGKLRLTFTVDSKTGVKLTGVIGKRGMLDRHIYEELDMSIEHEPGKKVFLFHTAISELKPQYLHDMESYPVSFLPKNFNYYAGGHVHIVERYDELGKGYRNVVYPGPLFPNSFSELERLHNGGYYIFDDNAQHDKQIIRKEIAFKKVVTLHIDVDGLQAHDASVRLQAAVEQPAVADAIVLLRVSGTLQSGNTTDIHLREAVLRLEEHGAHIVLRNTAQLSSEEFKSVQLAANDAPHEMETRLLAEHAAQLALPDADGVALARELLKIMSREPLDGEKTYDYETRISKDAMTVVDERTKKR